MHDAIISRIQSDVQHPCVSCARAKCSSAIRALAHRSSSSTPLGQHTALFITTPVIRLTFITFLPLIFRVLTLAGGLSLLLRSSSSAINQRSSWNAQQGRTHTNLDIDNTIVHLKSYLVILFPKEYN